MLPDQPISRGYKGNAQTDLLQGEILDDGIEELIRSDEERRGEVLDELLTSHPTDEVISRLADRFWDEPLHAASLISGSRLLEKKHARCRRIAIYYFSIGVGGAERVTCELIRIWRSMGYEVILLTDEPAGADDFEIDDDVERIVLPDFRTVNGRSYGARAKLLHETLVSRDIDALVYAQWMSRVLFWDMLVTKAAGASFIVHTHGQFGSLYRKWPLEALQPLFCRGADAIVCLSEMDASFWSHFSSRTFVTPNPLPYRISSIGRSSLHDHSILWVGRFDQGKHPFDAIAIMAEVTERIPDARLTMVGPVDDETRSAFNEAATRKNVRDKIDLAGAQTDMERYYLHASIFLMTSESEGFPMALFEAKAFGLPVVMYRLPYLTMSQPGTGVADVPMGSAHMAAQKIIGLFEDHDRLREMADASYDDAKTVAAFDYQGLWRNIFEETTEPMTPRPATTDMMWEVLLSTTSEHMQQALEDREHSEKTASELEERIEAVEGSKSYKLGKALIAPLRLLRRRTI